jgi:hypothetical protein
MKIIDKNIELTAKTYDNLISVLVKMKSNLIKSSN